MANIWGFPGLGLRRTKYLYRRCVLGAHVVIRLGMYKVMRYRVELCPYLGRNRSAPVEGIPTALRVLFFELVPVSCFHSRLVGLV